MKAKVVGIESGSKFVDGERRIALKFEDADHSWNELRVRASVLGGVDVKLDESLTIHIMFDAIADAIAFEQALDRSIADSEKRVDDVLRKHGVAREVGAVHD